jgi:HSP20 family molecular chaperone IbpA
MKTNPQPTSDASHSPLATEPVPYRGEQRARAWLPSVDILETPENIVVIADMPGVDGDDVEVTLDKGVLTISGAVGSSAPEGFQLAYREYEPRDFQRSFTVPDAIDQEHVAAEVRNGVLTLTLPKAKEAKPRRIQVKAS